MVWFPCNNCILYKVERKKMWNVIYTFLCAHFNWTMIAEPLVMIHKIRITNRLYHNPMKIILTFYLTYHHPHIGNQNVCEILYHPFFVDFCLGVYFAFETKEWMLKWPRSQDQMIRYIKTKCKLILVARHCRLAVCVCFVCSFLDYFV